MRSLTRCHPLFDAPGNDGALCRCCYRSRFTFLIVTSVSAAVVISATKTDTFVGVHDGDGKADPGETIEYTVDH